MINKTKDLSFRSYMLATGLERALYDSNRRKGKGERGGNNNNNKDSNSGAGAGAGAGAGSDAPVRA